MSYTIQQDENGYFIQIPQESLDELGWNQYTLLSVFYEEKMIILKQKTEWTVEELQEDDNLENVIEDIVHNGTIHYILVDDRKYVLAPYSEELCRIYSTKENPPEEK